MMIGRRSGIALGTFSLALALSLGVASVHAAACKGLEVGPCQRNASCSWVKPFVRKDGVKVRGHCKSRPRKSGGSGDSKKSGSK